MVLFPRAGCAACGRGDMATSLGWHLGDVQLLLRPEHLSMSWLLGAGCKLQCSPLLTNAFSPSPTSLGSQGAAV